jgi:hypothetical protein
MSEESGNHYKCEVCGSIHRDMASAEDCERRCRAKRDLFGETVKNADASHRFNFKYIGIFIVIVLVILGGSAFWYLEDSTSHFSGTDQELKESAVNDVGVEKTEEKSPLLEEVEEAAAEEEETDTAIDGTDSGNASPTIPEASSDESGEDGGGIPISLTDTQKDMLKSFGIDPDSLPEELTPEMEQCFIDKLGEERVNEIIGGAAPDIFDFFNAKSCIGY